ncbi:hypothetical protein KVR01_007018 [Diaporthe batatas]|uniref:uncharacterized protein n=1 Tax=Diaporthe batatas TaxID=748121 RepID=UPI001D046CED|nr:uncharacterized protein KVR01_007018 [Diaporthe batatas]KAG8163721.1 hypothetical protein KVR01_007018 [Diaporthe batatas]
MGLVEYSDSDSDSEPRTTSPPPPAAPAAPAAAPQPAEKQSFQKLVDKSNPGRIRVNLPSVSAGPEDATTIQAPAAKRLKTGGSRFSGFASSLPPPKAAKPYFAGGSSGKPTPRVGAGLKTSGEAAFSRDTGVGRGHGISATEGPGSFLDLTTAVPAAPAQPSIPHGQKSEHEVKLVGEALVFKPLSVARKPSKKVGGPKKAAAEQPAHAGTPGLPTRQDSAAAVPQAKKKKVSLFSVQDDAHGTGPLPEDSNQYEAAMCGHGPSTFPGEGVLGEHASQQNGAGHSQPPVQPPGHAEPASLDSIADDLNLDPTARRELFGRGGAPSMATAKSVINFNLDQEYQHNERLRQSGALDQQQHNPLRAIKPGKHSLQQLVNQVQSQRDALEESFAKNRATQKQSGAKYGF